MKEIILKYPENHQEGINRTGQGFENMPGSLPVHVLYNNRLLLQIHRILKSIHKGDNVNFGEINSMLRVIENEMAFALDSGNLQPSFPFYSALKRKLLFLEPSLTKSEIKICELLKAGLLCKEIALLMNLSLRTIESHRLNIRRKLKLKTNTKLDLFIENL